MGKPPAYIFVVRHGNRLDVVDKQWLLTSPTPYDPPLTYGGWLQARTVGAKIASILTEAEAENDAAPHNTNSQAGGSSAPGAADGTPRKKRRRRFKVALHTSPFLRCVQTATGISAGLCEPPGRPPPYPRTMRSNSTTSPSQAPKPISRRSTASPLPSPAISALGADSLDSRPQFEHRCFPKVVLRLDAFLGEWLSPDYFETITPPPSSSSMLTTAKAELLRREDYSRYSDPGLQVKPALKNNVQLRKSATFQEDTALNTMGRLSDALPDMPSGYAAPTPHYAISNNCRIPDGYVAHARDACLTVDYQWDSSMPPLSWGDGGTYGEEWTAMHKRFRNGVQNMVEWYASRESPTAMGSTPSSPTGGAGSRMSNGHSHESSARDGAVESADVDEEEEEESVVILVSHGAGCNALIGAITHQPALMDVGVASITMATRKEIAGVAKPDATTQTSFSFNLNGNKDHSASSEACRPVYQLYDLKMVASNDHLRGTANVTPTSPSVKLPSPRIPLGNGHFGFRGRINTMSSTTSGFSPKLTPFTYTDSGGTSDGGTFGKATGLGVTGVGSRSSSASASMGLGHLRRGSKSPSNLGSTGESFVLASGPGDHAREGSYAEDATPAATVTPVPNSGHTRAPSAGLWSPARHDEDDEDDYFPDFDNKRFQRRRPTTPAPALSSLSNTFATRVMAATNGRSQHQQTAGAGAAESPSPAVGFFSSESGPPAPFYESPFISASPVRQASETSDDYLARELGFTPANEVAVEESVGGGLWSPKTETRRRWTMDERS